MDAIYTVRELETYEGEVKERESQGTDAKFDAEHGRDENLTETCWSKFTTRLTPCKEFVLGKVSQATFLMVHLKNHVILIAARSSAFVMRKISQVTFLMVLLKNHVILTVKRSSAYLSKKAKQGETWILVTYILSLMAVVGMNSYFYPDISGKLPSFIYSRA